MSVRFFPRIDFAPPGVSPALPLLTELSPPSPLVTRSSNDPKLTLPPIGGLRGGMTGSRGGNGIPLDPGRGATCGCVDFLYLGCPGLSSTNPPTGCKSANKSFLPNINSLIPFHTGSIKDWKVRVTTLPPLDDDGKTPFKNASYRYDPSASAKPPTNNAPIGAKIGAKGPVNDPRNAPIPPPKPAKVALIAAFGIGSPSSILIPKSTSPPIIGSLPANLRTFLPNSLRINLSGILLNPLAVTPMGTRLTALSKRDIPEVSLATLPPRIPAF